jgi:two-component system chemotaxis response regulator CheY
MPIPATVPRDLPILVVDDFATMRRIVRNSLRQLGFTNVVEAADGNEALDRLKESEFQLIITEWNIPTIDGSDLLRAVRSDEKHRQTPLLVITTEAQRKNVAANEKSDRVATYVIKPLTTAVLEAKMSSLLEGK